MDENMSRLEAIQHTLEIMVLIFVALCISLIISNQRELYRVQEENAALMEKYIEVTNENNELIANLRNEIEEYKVALDLQVKYDSTKNNAYGTQLLNASGEVVKFYTNPPSIEERKALLIPEDKRDAVERVVQQEAGNQPFEGRKAVAQCIYNQALHYKESIYERACLSGQFAHEASYISEDTEKACREVFDFKDMPVDEPIMFFYSTAGGFYSEWHEQSPNLQYVCTIADHKFYKLKGT